MEWPLFILWLIFSSLGVFAGPEVHKDPIEIYSLHVDCKVTSRFAHTVITSRVVNRAEESKEAHFEVELPKKAFITNFSMAIDGVVYPGIIKEKKSAQDQYDAAVSRGQSAGLVKSTGRKLEQFHVSVNVAPTAKVTFELIYEELLKRNLGNYELLIKVRPKQLVHDFKIDVHIWEPQGISFLESQSTFMTNELNEALTKTQGDTKAHISFKPTLNQQRKTPGSEETLLDGDFMIRYDVNRSLASGDVQVKDARLVAATQLNSRETLGGQETSPSSLVSLLGSHQFPLQYLFMHLLAFNCSDHCSSFCSWSHVKAGYWPNSPCLRDHQVRTRLCFGGKTKELYY